MKNNDRGNGAAVRGLFPRWPGRAWSLISPSAPAWKVNLLVFGILILVVQVNFYHQARQAEKVFTDNVKEHSVLLAEVVRLNAKGAVLARDVVKEIMETFLLNASHFIDYLDSVEAFGEAELTALAREIGLAGIRVTAEDGSFREGPPGWFEADGNGAGIQKNTLRHASGQKLFYLEYPRFRSGSILTGVASGRFEALRRKVGLSELLETVTGLAGIRYVRLEKRLGTGGPVEAGAVRIIDTPGGRVAETRLPLGEETMVVGMGCELYYARVKQNRREFFLFSGVMLVAGIICSLLLYSHHRAHLAKVRRFEQSLAREREDAALGRAVASVTHEIRNPLNAIAMGLQRLEMEAEDLEDDHRKLIAALMGSVRRTDRIIADLKRYTGPLSPNPDRLRLGEIVSSTLNIYAGRIEERKIRLDFTGGGTSLVLADRDMCGIIVENLVKNAVEAQENGGFIRIEIGREGEEAVTLTVVNGGFKGDESDPDRILEPYYTTKTRGSGVGLALVRRIVAAHGGSLELSVPERETLRIIVTLPGAG